MDAGDAVADLQDGADLLDLHGARVLLDLASQDLRDLVGSELHLGLPSLLRSVFWTIRMRRRRRRPAPSASACAELVDAVAHGAVHDGAADAQHEAADDLRVDRLGELDRAAGLRLDALDDPLAEVVGQGHGGDGLDLEPALLGRRRARRRPGRSRGTRRCGPGRSAPGGSCPPSGAARPEVSSSTTPFLARVSISGFSSAARSSSDVSTRLGEGRDVARDGVDRAGLGRRLVERLRVGARRRSLAGLRPVRDGREVRLVDRLLDQAPVVLVAQALARDLLGRQQRQRDDVVAQAARRGAGLGVDLDLGVGQDALALALGLGDELRALALALLAALLAQLVGLLAGLAEAGLVVVEQRAGLVAAALGLLDARRDVGAALLDRRPRRARTRTASG